MRFLLTAVVAVFVSGCAIQVPLSEPLHPVARIVANEAQRQGISPQLAVAVAKTESGLNPNARSSHGAVGLMQIMPGTWRSMRCEGRMTDPHANARCGVRYLAQGLSEGDQHWALVRYNGGPGARRNSRSGQKYVRMVMAHY